MNTDKAKEILPNLYEMVVFAKENKLVMDKKGSPSYYQLLDHLGEHWNLWISKFPNINIELGKAYLVSYIINEKGYPDVQTIRLIQNVFKQNAIKELQSRDSILKNISVALAYSKDLVIADKIPLDAMYEYSDKIYEYLQNKADEVIGL